MRLLRRPGAGGRDSEQALGARAETVALLRMAAPALASGRPPSASVQEWDHGAAFVARGSDERRVRGGQALSEGQGGRQRGAVGERQGTPDPIVVLSVKSSGAQAHRLIDGEDLQAAQGEPADLLLHFIRRPALVPYQHVEHFGDIDRADRRRVGRVAQQRFDLGRRGLAGQGRDERLGVKDGQRRRLFCS